ncbi:MAG: hypothetical protein ABIO29_05365 [Sphingomicrobium sp.]
MIGTKTLLTLAGIATAASASPAIAGPWTMDQGKGRIITSLIYSHAADKFDNDGDATAAPDYDQTMAFALVEYGLTDRLTLVANPGLRRIEIAGAGSSTGLAPSEFGVRYRLAQGHGSILSAQISGFAPGSTRSSSVAQIGTNDWQADARLQAGTSFKLGKANAFASAEAGYRLRSGSPPNEFHGDAAIGVHASERLLLLANLFSTWSDGKGASGYPSYRYSNLYAGGVMKLNSSLSLQLGGLATISGRNALRERGIYTGFWLDF